MARTNRTPGQLRSDSAIGGYITRSRHDPRDYTAKARLTWLTSFEDEVDPGRTLDETERLKRAEALMRARMKQLSKLGVQARRGKR